MSRLDRGTFLVIFPALLLAGWLRGADDQAEKKVMPVTVKAIKQVEVALTKNDPPGLTVTVVGEVPTGGFTDVKLVPYNYVKQPDDGIQDFTLTAVPPDGPAIQALQEVTATYTFETAPKWLKGVRIHGEPAIEKRFQ